MSQMLPSCGSPVLLICLPCWVSAVFGGSATCTGRSMAESPRTSSMVNLLIPRGRPRLRYKDALKRDLAAFGIPNTTWESTASNHSHWRSAVYNGCSTSTQLYIDDCESRRLHRRSWWDGPWWCFQILACKIISLEDWSSAIHVHAPTKFPKCTYYVTIQFLLITCTYLTHLHVPLGKRRK